MRSYKRKGEEKRKKESEINLECDIGTVDSENYQNTKPTNFK